MKKRPVFHPVLGAYFAQLRHRKNWSQRQATAIARNRALTAIGKHAIARLERGEAKHPDRELLEALSLLYDVPIEEIVRRVTEASYPPASATTASQVSEAAPLYSADVGSEEEAALLLAYRSAGKAVKGAVLRALGVNSESVPKSLPFRHAVRR